MKVTRVASEEIAGDVREPRSYRIREWGPSTPGMSRTMDEWDVSGVFNVIEAILWATSNISSENSFEIFAVTTIPRPHGSGVQPIFVRVFGVDGDPNGGAGEVVNLFEG